MNKKKKKLPSGAPPIPPYFPPLSFYFPSFLLLSLSLFYFPFLLLLPFPSSLSLFFFYFAFLSSPFLSFCSYFLFLTCSFPSVSFLFPFPQSCSPQLPALEVVRKRTKERTKGSSAGGKDKAQKEIHTASALVPSIKMIKLKKNM